MKLRLKMVLLLVALPLCLAAKAQGAGFDCSKATTKIEKMICVDAELSKLDEQLDTAYKTALQDKKQAGAVRQAQKQWLRERDTCMDSACVKQKYELRIEALLSSQVLIETAETESAGKENNTPSPVKKQLYGFCSDIRGSRACGPRSGKGYTVCEKYLECLNSLPDTPKCEIPVPPGFTEPVWEEVDYMQHLDWAYQIARGKFVGTDPMSFDEWKPLFLNHIADGWLSPQMKKTRVTPLGDKTVILLAFTEDANGCKRPYEPEKRPKYARWNGFGYLYCILVEDPATPLRMIGRGINSISEFRQSILLLYAGRPCFIRLSEPYESVFENELSILTFFPQPRS